jgi:hypothetical protein
MRAVIITSSLACAVAGPALAQSENSPVRLVPHRAVYDISLARSDSSSRGIDTARGRIAFDFGGDACEGYTLKYRQVTVIEGGETGSRTLDVRTATYESGNGRSMRFKNDSRSEGGVATSTDGEADITSEGSLAIRLKQPRRETLTVPGETIFPTEHMKRLIAAAKHDETKLGIKLFDGADDGKKVYDTLSLIGRRIEPGAGASLEDAAKQDALAKIARWPVTVSYYNAGTGDQMPAYTISFDLYENGISRAIRLDYGDFALKGDLKTVEVQPYTECQR